VINAGIGIALFVASFAALIVCLEAAYPNAPPPRVLRSVKFFKVCARLILIVCVGAAAIQPFAHAYGVDIDGVRAIRTAIAIAPALAVRSANGTVLTRSGVRLDRVGHPTHLQADLRASRSPISPPGVDLATTSLAASARLLTSRTSEPLRGPPQAI
jgi:hypothetical protein